MKQKHYAFLLVCLVLGTALRFYNIGKYGLLGDELYAFTVANFTAQEGAEQESAFRKNNSPYFTNVETHQKRDLGNYLTAVSRRDNGSAALHSISLHYWMKMFGISDTSLRAFSATFNVGLLVFLFFFIVTVFGNEKLALLSCFLASISPFYITFSQVARSYTMLFTLALISTLLLIKCLKKNKISWNHFSYGIVALMLLMSHYSSFVILGLHAVYSLIYFQKIRTIAALALASMIPVLGLTLWLVSPGGSWAFHAIEHSKNTYMQEALLYNDPFIQLSTWRTVPIQLLKVFTLSFLPLEVVYHKLEGFKNWGFTLLHTVFVVFILKQTRPNLHKTLAILLLAISLVFVLSKSHLAFLQVSYALALITYFANNFRLRSTTALLLIFPLSLLFLAVFAIMDGNTFRIIPRYSGYGYAFGLVIWATIILKSWNSQDQAIRTLLIVHSLLFFFFWTQSLEKIYQDKPVRYFHVLDEPRMANPYAFIAQKIEESYQPGDTVIYPSVTFKKGDPGYDMPAYSVQDAQYVNFYLRSSPPEIIQRVDTTEQDKVFIKNSLGKKTVLFDFKNGKYRY